MRRTPRVCIGLAVLAATLLATAPAHADTKFKLGVAAGEITADSAKLWGKATEAGNTRAQVATDGRFRDVLTQIQVEALPENDLTLQTTVEGLRADRTYHYRFCADGRCSNEGRFNTPPKPTDGGKITFAFSGDTDATAAPGETEPFHGAFKALRSMRLENNDFNIHIGDTIYSDSEVAGSPPALTVEEKWAKYKLNLREDPLADLRSTAGTYTHWDDHEFINDFSIPERGQPLYDAGVKAFTDYAPVSYEPADGLYRSFRWGRNLELFFLDQRSFRDADVTATNVCDNPDTDQPDLAPTAPQGTRDLFALLIPSLAEPVSQACKDAINDPNRTMLGESQFDAFLDEVEASDARWKVVMNETPIQQFYGLPYDRWEGYAYERVELLNELQARGVANLVFLTTDTHADFANVVRERTLVDDVAPTNAPGTSPVDTPYSDFVAGPVATNTFWTEIDEVTGSPGNGETLSELFFKADLPVGVRMFCAQGDQDSYGEVTVAGGELVVDYRKANGKPVKDVDGTRCGPYTLEHE